MPLTYQTLAFDDAKHMISAAEVHALTLEIPYCVAVVDAAGDLLAFARQDGARRACVELAIGKAATARLFNAATADLNAMAAPGGPLYGIAQVNGGKVVLLGGGLPIIQDGVLLGAIGASAGTAEQDVVVAQSGINALSWFDHSGAGRQVG